MLLTKVPEADIQDTFENVMANPLTKPLLSNDTEPSLQSFNVEDKMKLRVAIDESSSSNRSTSAKESDEWTFGEICVTEEPNNYDPPSFEDLILSNACSTPCKKKISVDAEGSAAIMKDNERVAFSGSNDSSGGTCRLVLASVDLTEPPPKAIGSEYDDFFSSHVECADSIPRFLSFSSLSSDYADGKFFYNRCLDLLGFFWLIEEEPL